MEYVFASYSGEDGFELLTKILEFLMVLALIAIITILIIYAREPVKWKKAYLLVRFSMYITSLVYAMVFLLFRWYVSIPLNCVLLLLFAIAEKSEIKTIKRQFNIPNQKNIKSTNKYFIVATTCLTIFFALGYMYCNNIVYLG